LKSSKRAQRFGLRALPALFGLAAAAQGCLSVAPGPLPDAVDAPTPEPGKLHVRLVFGEEADLDLYVTDPRQETVYFGNSPSLAGGALHEDLRCDAPAPRVERVQFPAPAPGRYRVGVAFSARCTRVRQAVPYRIEIEGGALRIDESGEISPGHFDHKVVEFEWDGSPHR